MKVGFLITVRLKSNRLPQKVMLKVQGESYITWMIRRLKLQSELDEIILCTSTNPEDDPLESVAEKEGVHCFRGSEEDVFERLNEARLEYKLDYVINITADCPLVPFDLIPDLVKSYREKPADLITCHHLPVGLYLSGLSVEAMDRLMDIKASETTEYWLYYFLKSDLFEVRKLETDPSLERTGYRLALDYSEDHEMFTALYNGMGPTTYASSTKVIVEWLDAHPEVVKLNEGCDQKGAKRTEEDPTSKVKLKDGSVLS